MKATNDFHNMEMQNQIDYSDAVKWVRYQRRRRDVHYTFAAHYHPYVETLIERLNTDGLNALLDPAFHRSLETPLAPALYTPGPFMAGGFPKHEIDVSDDGPYAIYNWELFFHAPLLVAVHLSKNQRFAEAQRWFHRIFDPTSTDTSVPAPQRFWRFLRFRQETDPQFVTEILAALADTEDSELKRRTIKALTQWRDYPFQPHVVARGRYLAYQMSVVMKYLDNLIAWGDNLFRQDTVETLNEATQIYVLAANLLGPKPQAVPTAGRRNPRSYAQLKAAGVDAFGNALVEIENEFPFNSSGTGAGGSDSAGTSAVFGIGRSLYFCIPQNAQLLTYWDTVADRLFKMRHCMNIEGVVRQLALFEPPIDPGALVKAVAAGLDIGSIVNNIAQPVSTIRGWLLLQKAQEICNEVKSLGQSLLSAIEKGEAEHLALLRQQHELAMHTLTRETRFLQWKEAEAATEALLRSRATVWERYRHYKKILGVADSDIDKLKSVELVRSGLTEQTFDTAYGELVSAYSKDFGREAYRKETSVGGIMEFAGQTVADVFGGKLGDTLPLNKNENAELNIFLPASDTFGAAAAILNFAAPILGLIPQFDAHGTPIGVGAKVGFGGVQLNAAAKGGAKVAEQISATFRSSADRASKMATYYRRAEDYVLQANLATSELEQYGRQIIASLLREQIAKREYDNQVAAIDNAAASEEFLRTKFTNEDLYTWMRGQLAQTYYDCYKLAFDIAKKAELTLKHEAMRPDFENVNFVKFGYWNAGREGLLAGETLSLDLRRLELAYLEQNTRELELIKHVSLARLDPLALLRLKAAGACEVTVPEWLFDMDSPGHYMRRLKTVAVTVPCVTGPYTGVHCTLSLLRSSVRVSSLSGDQYARAEDVTDDRFRDYSGAIQSIVTSSGQNDSGIFEVNLRDDRYLPFEGAGAISTWRIQLPTDIPQFDVETVSDVVLHLRYTAREAGNLRQPALDHVTQDVLTEPDNLIQLFTLNHDFVGGWNAFVKAPNDAARHLAVSIDVARFPYWVERLGMGDALVATFAVIDWNKGKLTLAPSAVTLDGDAGSGWKLDVAQGDAIFSFLKKNVTSTVYMAVSYAASS